MAAIWPKYTQIALFDMCKELKQDPVEMSPEDFASLPKSSVQNFKDYSLFKDFLPCEIEVEALRALKLQILTAQLDN